MLAKKFAFGFGIAIILPMLVHYGVSTFVPQPKWEDYSMRNEYSREQNASPEEKIKLAQERDRLEVMRKVAEKNFETHLFIVAVPVGLAAIIIGTWSGIQALGTGLIFGGIFTLIDGYACYWSELQDWMRFFSLLVAFIVLAFMAYWKANEKSKVN